MKIVRKILFYLNVVLVIITLLAYLSPFVNPTLFWGLAILGLLVPFLLLFNLLYIFYWLATNWKYAWLSVLCLFIGSNYIPQTISLSSQKEVENYDFSIASFNLHYGYGNFKKGVFKYDEQSSAKFGGFLKKELNSDILCAQESNQHTRDLISGHYDYRHVPDNTATAIFSRFPIINSGNIDFGTRTNSCIWADLLIKNDTIRIYTLHLKSNNISTEADLLAEEVEKNKKLNTIKVRSILGKYTKFVKIRSVQAQKVRKHMDQSPHPLILAGDFNDPPVSYSYRVLSHELQDAFAVAGNGLGNTYAGVIPMLRIDNIIAGEQFKIESFRTIYKKFSDHYPVISKISLTQ